MAVTAAVKSTSRAQGRCCVFSTEVVLRNILQHLINSVAVMSTPATAVAQWLGG